MEYYLGVDCGGSFIKAAIFNSHKEIIALTRHNLEIISEKEGWVERDPLYLWNICAQVIKKTIEKSQINNKDIKGIGISAQGKGLFLLDKNKQILGNGILSSDQRAMNIVKKWQNEHIPEKLYPITRQTLWTGHPVSILRWLKENDFKKYSNIGAILMTHDYLRYCLTGMIHCEKTNISESNFYNMAMGKYDPTLTRLLDIEEMNHCLPSIIEPNEVAGFINKESALLTGLAIGTPVVGGLFDVVSTALCSNLTSENKLNVVLGTWSVVSGITSYIDKSKIIPFVYGQYINPEEYIVHEASPTSAGNLEWFLQQWGSVSYDDINREVALLPPAKSSIIFIPFLYGSNAGFGMKAGLYGIQSYHNKFHVFQAIFEGVLFSLMFHLERMLQRFPHTDTLVISGGVTKSDVWLQMLADFTQMKLEVLNIEETGCLGAALMAMPKNEQNLKQYGYKNICPNKKHKILYDNKYLKYKKLIKALQSINNDELIN